MNTLETYLAEQMLGGVAPSLLMTDAYKLSMAQAGFPLRRETFYLSLRRPGAYLVPCDLAAVVRALLPRRPAPACELDYLERFDYAPTAAMRAAMAGELELNAPPPGSWLLGREPLLTVTGPSFLASWLEPMAIWLHYPIQVATELVAGRDGFVASCRAEAEIIRSVAASLGLRVDVAVRSERYYARARAAAEGLLGLVGEAERVFEVGMRAATCLPQHLLALTAGREAGLRATSDVWGARELDLTPVGTAGHEHQMRWGADACGFRALRDTRPGPPSYLLDTYDVDRLGLPTARTVMAEDPGRACSVRFDSGDQEGQLRRALGLFGPLAPSLVFEDGYDAARTARMESLCDELGVDRERRLYGYGSRLVARPAETDLTRDRVSAVYKLSASGGRPVMKFSAGGKQSAPGVPVVLRRTEDDGARPVGLIGQAGETPPPGYARLDALAPLGRVAPGVAGPSPATRRLIDELTAARDQRLDDHRPTAQERRTHACQR